MIFNNIVHPITGNSYSLFSTQGRALLKKYVNLYQNGGSEGGASKPEGGASKGSSKPMLSLPLKTCADGEGCCGTVEDFSCPLPLFEQFLKKMKKETYKTEWTKHMIYVLEHYGYKSFFELFGLGNSWEGKNNNMNCPWLVYDRLFSEFLKPNALMTNYIERRGEEASKWFKESSAYITILSILATAGTYVNMYTLVLWFVDKVRYEGVINGYLPLSGYIDDDIIRTKILKTHTIKHKEIQFDTIKYTGDNPTLYKILNKSYKICFGPENTLDRNTNYMMTRIDGYGPLHFCSIGRPPKDSNFQGPCIYNVCKVTNAVKIKGGCKILIQNVLNNLFKYGWSIDKKTPAAPALGEGAGEGAEEGAGARAEKVDSVCLLVRINTDIRFPYTINYPAIRCYLQSGFKFVNSGRKIIEEDFSCNGDFESFKNKLRSYIFKQRKTLLQTVYTDGANALMVCIKPETPFVIETIRNIEVTSALPSNNSDVKYTFKSNGIDIPYYDDVYGINPEVFHVNDVKVVSQKVEMPISPRSMNAKSIRKIQKKNPGLSVKDLHSLNQTESSKLRTEQSYMIRKQKRLDNLARKRQFGQLGRNQKHDCMNFRKIFETMKNNIIRIMKRKMQQGPPLMCAMPSFSPAPEAAPAGAVETTQEVREGIIINNYGTTIPLILKNGLFIKGMLTNYLIHNKINPGILNNPSFFDSLLENVKLRLDNIDLKCKFISETDIAFDKRYNKTQFITKNNVITKEKSNIEMLKNIFNVKRGVPLALIMERQNEMGHVVWAIKMGSLPIIICRQRANNGNCPIIHGYDNILTYLKDSRIRNVKYIFNKLDTSAPIKFGNLFIVKPVTDGISPSQFVSGAGKSSSPTPTSLYKDGEDSSMVDDL